jgi:hypothetical protein
MRRPPTSGVNRPWPAPFPFVGSTRKWTRGLRLRCYVVRGDFSHSGLSEVNAGVVRKILVWLFVGFLIFFAAKRPDAAAAVVRFIAALLAGLANGLSDMVSHVVT